MEDNNLSIEAKRLSVLEDTCTYFNLNNRNVESGTYNCLYYPVSDKTEGCAIGRLIKDKELCKRLDLGIGFDQSKGVSFSEVFKLLPDELQELGKDFLTALQSLHDSGTNWTDMGLSPLGVIQKNNLQLVYCNESQTT